MSLRCLTAWEQNLDSKSTDNWNWSKKCLRSFFFFEGRLIMHQFSDRIFQRMEFLMFLFPSHLFIALSSAISQLFLYIYENWGFGIRCDLINNIYASKIGKDNAKRSMQQEEVKWKKKKIPHFFSFVMLCRPKRIVNWMPNDFSMDAKFNTRSATII